jgi:PAS domain S-box-containing protein
MSERFDYLEKFFDNLDVGVLIADDSAVYVDANQAACRLYGRPRSEVVGHHLSEFIDGARVADVNIQWDAFIRHGSQHGVFAVRRPDGTHAEFQFHALANFVRGLHCSLLTAVSIPGQDNEAHNLITMCAWTKRVLISGTWISIEEYLSKAHGLLVSHGISPDAAMVFKHPSWKRSDPRL